MNTCANPIVRVGVDLSKHLFQVHAVDRSERVVYAKALVREKFLEWCAKLPAGCLVAVEACGGAHDVARRLGALGLDARLIAAHFVEPYRIQGRSGKNDANDAAAICEAVSHPRTRFVPVKSVQQQGLLSIHRLREGYKADCTACINRIRSLLAEFGLVFPTSPEKLRTVLQDVIEDASNALPNMVRLGLQRLHLHWMNLLVEMAWCDERIAQHVRQDSRAQQIMQLIGVGPLTASALTASVDDFAQFASAQQFGAWLGLVPSQHSTGGKARLGGISKRGNSYLRTLLIQGAKAVVRTVAKHTDRISLWLQGLLKRLGWQRAAVALANKNVRIIWAIMTRGTAFDANHVPVHADKVVVTLT
jgi:transposase